MSADVVAVREGLGAVSGFFPVQGISQLPPTEVQRDAVRRLERAGYRATWTNEGVGGRDALVHAGVLLAATEQLVLGTSIASMWARAPEQLHAGASLLAEAYPGRFVLGVGAGYSFQAERVGRRYQPALTHLADYLARMPATDTQVQPPPGRYARLIAANGPKMLALAREATDGAKPTMVPPSFTASARQQLGPEKLLVVGVATIGGDDRDTARAAATAVLKGTLNFPDSPYRANLARQGYTTDELDSGTGRVLDDVIAYGTPEDIAAQAQRHLDAGADHVILTTMTGSFERGIDLLERVAPAVTSLARRELAA